MEARPSVEKFWESSRNHLVGSGIPNSRARWHVHMARKFTLSIKGKPLRAGSAEDADRFLQNLCAESNLEPWQVVQARDVIVVL